MIKFEKVLGFLALLGLVLKILLIPGGGILLVFFGLILSVLYFLFGFALLNKIAFKKIFKKDSYKLLKDEHLIIAIASGISFFLICFGIIYKIQHWSGFKMNFLIGLFISLLLLVITLMKFFKTKGEFYIRVIKRIVIIGVLGLVFFCFSDLAIIKFQFRNHPEYIKAYEMYLSNPDDVTLRKNLSIEYHRAIMSEEEFNMYKKTVQNN